MRTVASEGVDPTLAGAAVTLALAGIGFLGTRKSRTESTGVLVDAAVALAKAATESEDQARDEIRELRAEVVELRGLVEACERKHEAAAAALTSAGIAVPDV